MALRAFLIQCGVCLGALAIMATHLLYLTGCAQGQGNGQPKPPGNANHFQPDPAKPIVVCDPTKGELMTDTDFQKHLKAAKEKLK